jgi:hypothetical protein
MSSRATRLLLAILGVLAMTDDARPEDSWLPPVPPPLEAGDVEAARKLACAHFHGGRDCRITRGAHLHGPYFSFGTFIADERGLSVVGEPKGHLLAAAGRTPGAPPNVLLDGVPMTRAQLRHLLDHPRYPSHPLAIARAVIATNRAALGLDRVHDGELQGLSVELCKVARHPEVSGPPGERRFSFDASGPLHTRSRVTVKVDGEGLLEPTVVALLPAPAAPSGPAGLMPPLARPPEK